MAPDRAGQTGRPTTASPADDEPDRAVPITPDDPLAVDPEASRLGTPAAVALGLLAGLCICAALPPWGWWPLALVGIALWVHVLGGRGGWARFWIGWAVGVGWFGPSTLWIWGLTGVGYPPTVLLGWGPYVGLAALVCPPDRRRVLALPAVLVVFEWLHVHVPFGGIPLSMLGMTQVDTLLPIARLGGELLVAAAVAALGVAVWLSGRHHVTATVVTAVVLGLVVVGGVWPVGTPVDTVMVAAIQGGGPQGTRYRSGEETEVFRRHMEATALVPEDAGVDLVVWPENAINVSGRFVDHPWLDDVRGEAARIGAPVVVGVVEDGPDVETTFSNFVTVVGPDGEVGDRYDKVRRVPFGEYVPLRSLFELFAEAQLPQRDQVPGDDVAVVDTHARELACPPEDPPPPVCDVEVGRVAVAISWEIFFSRRVREGVREGGQLVLNPTNGASYWLTQVQSQQVAASRLRAVESGRWVVQAAPTGFSAFISPDGEVLQRTDVSEQAVLYQEVDLLTGTTPAQALGATPALVLAAAGLALAWAPRRRVDRTDTTGAAPHS